MLGLKAAVLEYVVPLPVSESSLMPGNMVKNCTTVYKVGLRFLLLLTLPGSVQDSLEPNNPASYFQRIRV